MYKSFLIKYAEIGIKGKNRYIFENALIKQIKNALLNVEGKFEVTKEQGRLYVDALSEYDYEDVVEAIQRVFGIVAICPVKIVDTTDWEVITKEVANYIDEVYDAKDFTFKVAAKRANKSYWTASLATQCST